MRVRGLVLARQEKVQVRFGPNPVHHFGPPPNPEPDFRFGSGLMLNLRPDFGPVQKSSGPNRGSEPDSGITIRNHSQQATLAHEALTELGQIPDELASCDLLITVLQFLLRFLRETREVA